MSTISFDTHTFVKRLTQEGMPIGQAEVLADSQARLIDDKLATKHDLNELGAGLTRDLKALETKLTHDIKALETKQTRDIKELETKLTLDLKELETKLSRDIKELEPRFKDMETRLSRDINKLALKLTIRLGYMLVIAIGVVATLVKLL